MTMVLENLPESSAWLMVLVKMTALLAAAWTLHWLLLARNPRWRVMLWRSVMAGLILLPALEVAMPAMRVEVPSPPALQIRYVTVPAADPDDGLARWRRPYGLRPGAYDLAAASAPKQSLLDWAREHVALLLLAAWGLVTVVLAGRTATLLLRVRRIVQSASPAPETISSRLLRIAGDLQCSKHVGLRLTAALVSPFLTRILQPIILLPEKMTSPDRHAELDGILAHELAHVQGNDLVWLLLARGISCVLWFHPLVWRIAGAHSRACEEVCDAVAAEYVGGAPAYSGMLARVALELMADAPADGGVSMVRAATILQRVRLLKRGIRAAALTRSWIVTSLGIGCIALLILGSLKIAYADKSHAGTASKPGNPTASDERKPVMTSVKREGSRAWVEGLANQAVGRISSESQMHLMEILLKHRGETADAKELMVLSGDAFNLCHPAHWQGGYSQLCIPTDPLANVARAYGYNSRWFNSNLWFYQINKLPAEQKRQKLDELHQTIRRQIEAGKPVLMGGAYGDCGSWRVVAGIDMDKQQLCYVGGEKPYDWVDVQKDRKVAEFGFWDEQVRGAIRDGFMGNWQSNVAFLLEDRTQAPSQKDRLINALRLAVDLFQDREHNREGMNYLGRRAYAEWANELNALDYPADKAKADAKAVFPWYSLDSMTLQVDSIIRGRTAAADYVDSHAAVLPKVADRLKAAAAHYRKEAALAREAFSVLLTGDKEAGETWLSDKANRDAAAKVVRRMMAQEEAAVAEISKALATEGVEVTVTIAIPPERLASKAKVMHEDGKTWIAGTENLAWPDGSENTVLRSFAAVARIGGRDVTYEEVMGLGGAAFRMQILTKGLCPSSPHAFCGFNCLKPAIAALGYTSVDYPYQQDDPDGVQRTRAAIIESINQGLPVLFGSEEAGLVVGYKDAGQTLLVRPPYGSKGPGFDEWKGWPWGFLIFRPKGNPLGAHEAAVASLKQAVMLAGSESFDNYTAGFAAYDRWIGILEDEKVFPHDEKDRTWGSNLLGNAFMYSCLLDARRCAARYLTSVQGSLNPQAAAHVAKAADIYGQIAATLDAGMKNIRFPWRVAKDGPFTPQMRESEVQTLKQVRGLERQAVGEIEAALKAEGVAVPTETTTHVANPAVTVVGASSPANPPEDKKAANGKESAKVVKLEGLKQPKMWMTRPGCLISCAQYLKVNASSAWIYGGTGYAFALNIHKDICPSGPTAWPSEECDTRAANVGLVVKTFGTDKRQEGFEAAREKIWQQTRAAIDAGLPCFGWELNIPDWCVIQGYDAQGNYLFDDFGRAEGRKPYTKLGDSEIGVAVVQSVSPGKPADDRTVVREAIRFAIDNSQGKGSQHEWHTGLTGYDTWVAALTDEEALAKNTVIGFGMGYNATCWNETRKYAVQFLAEAKKRLDDRKLDPLFDQAIECYSTVSASLAAVAKLYPNHDPAAQAQVMDPDRRDKAVTHLKAAKEAEAKGLATLAKIGDRLAKQ